MVSCVGRYSGTRLYMTAGKWANPWLSDCAIS